MELYPSGLTPAGYPADAAAAAAAAAALPLAVAGVVAGVVAAPSVPAEALPEDDMELLERILRDCHIGGGAAAAAAPAASLAADAAMQQGSLLAPNCALPVGQQVSSSPQMLPQQDVQKGVGSAAEAATATVEQWADEMVRQLQTCASAESARPLCASMLAAFRQQSCEGASAADAQRLRTLQGANGALLRGFRNIYQKSREAEVQRQRAEEANAALAAELARCQEALKASERQRGMLQYHLEIVSRAPGTAAGGM
eukprot:TRINITY_DN23411_c0_g1_i1.p1 TRINITY_DN23411_c0_g1~~TRINITY_DN23411_c0_g1_i1.p1  ORF type:complete len:256 (-),score=68.81 TRINITY_DN23411_c0_g1_i1:118-885(-)